MFYTWIYACRYDGHHNIVPNIKNNVVILQIVIIIGLYCHTTIVSKLFKSISIILYKCEEFLYTCDNQFGFKPKHSTELCIYTLKEFIDCYKQRSTTVFVTFLDASKAFDKINYWLLFQKLFDKGFLTFIIKILAFWYTHQKVHVRWGTTTTTPFLVTNGVKQGGIYRRCYLMCTWMI